MDKNNTEALQALPEGLLDLLSSIIFNQLAVEKNEALMGTVFYKKQLKPKLQAVIKYLEPSLKKEYNKAFAEDEIIVQSALFSIEKIVDYLSRHRIEQLILLASMLEAHEINPKAVEGIITKVLTPKKILHGTN